MQNSIPSPNPFTLVVADIHLQPEQEHPINQAFYDFLELEAAKADALYILGDLFEIWVGDDIGLEQYSTIIQKFKSLTDAGLPIYLQYGNRDFLMKQAFCVATGITILDDITVARLYNEPYLFLHGDSLCTDDIGYQRMRKLFRNRLVQWIFLHLSRKRRLTIGNKMRHSSKQHSQQKTPQIMDVNQNTVCELFKLHPQVNHMVHGHTHRPEHHIIEAEHKRLHRWVLGDWRPQAKIILIDHNGPQLIDYPNHC
ncbi:UDP-2,3-diacylglucosamine hydrolase [Thiomicrorhabdus immobilis]|uniref:UDP-2,3-diacylglucosamine hydrolase n=1 Tax=Thiomicrorhabdus immobilis TaxID=2791037 RepID=A0ABN6CYA2_9GAMM|nr:UDP-2,3-diacylglucosamine diphosphatase [Thiomicrorhabdus immobilis]BCN93579.1 UDP-2,3-diacylglucosamine hydrolase [Thiomicrorhabdus immobilis]